jgi:alkylation response protein AidB-like acyl-CoA dehydrogenase
MAAMAAMASSNTMTSNNVSSSLNHLFHPSEELFQLRQTVKSFAQDKILPGARERDANEKFDMKLFKQCGDLGLLGVT